MKRLLLLLAGTAALCAGCSNNFDRNMTTEAREYTQKHCPEKLDEFTTLDSMAYDSEDRTLWQYLTVEDAVAELLRSNAPSIKETLLANLRNDAKWKTCKDKETNFGYIYKTRNGNQPVCRIVLKPVDYQ